MRRFIITHPRLTGKVELCYKENELLCVVDLKSATIEKDGITKFLKNVPSSISDLQSWSRTFDCTIVEADFEVTFDMFWERYSKKINRKRCEKLWDKLNKQKQVFAFFGTEAYDNFLKAEGWRSKADPENYLRNEYWLNEYK